MSVPREEATFRSLLREHRLAAGLTQEALSERSGVSARTIQEVEAGHTHPRRATVLDLARALGLSGSDRDELLRVGRPRPRPRITAIADTGAVRHVVPDLVSPPEPSVGQSARGSSLLVLQRPTPTNIPWPISSLLGRDADLAAIRDLIVGQRRRLVTLIGVGGAGKTRLAIQAARDLLDEFVDGVWFVELASTADSALVPRSVAGALGVYEDSNVPIIDTLLGFLRLRQLALVLDNCEHLIEACADLAARLLAACPDLVILATSREPLQIDGEQRRPVRPLDVPDLSGSATLAALEEIASVRLFVERARAIDPDFALTEENATWVAQVCARLDGIPLAIELAASRIGVLAADQIAARLADGFRLLASGARSAPTRQQTMEAALAWSYDLLTPTEQATFRAMSTFAGGFDLEAAEAACGPVASSELGGAGGPPAGAQLATRNSQLDLLGSLVDKSLVVSERTPHGRRYRLLEPVRQYAALQLVRAGASEQARARHAAYYATLAERAEPLLRGPDQVAWLGRFDQERNNLRAALSWIAEHGSMEDGFRLAVAMTPYWEAYGYFGEGRRWLDMLLSATQASSASRVLTMRALLSTGLLAKWLNDFVAAEPPLTAALALARELGDRPVECEALIWLSTAYWRRGEIERGMGLGRDALQLAYEVGEDRPIALALATLGAAWRYECDPARSLAYLEEALDRYRRVGDVRYVGMVLTSLGDALVGTGAYERGEAALREALRTLQAAGERRYQTFALRGLANLCSARHRPRQAAVLLGASMAVFTSLGMRISARDAELVRATRDSLRQRISEAEFDDAYAAGQAMSLDQVLAEIDSVSVVDEG